MAPHPAPAAAPVQEVSLRDMEAILRCLHDLEPEQGAALRGDQVAAAGTGATPNPPPQLVQRRQPEALCPLHHHHCGLRYVDPHLCTHPGAKPSPSDSLDFVIEFPTLDHTPGTF